MEAAVQTWLASVTIIQAELDELREEEVVLKATLHAAQVISQSLAAKEALARASECSSIADKITLCLKRMRLLAEVDALSTTAATLMWAQNRRRPPHPHYKSDGAIAAHEHLLHAEDETRMRLDAARVAEKEAKATLEAQASEWGILDARAATARVRAAADTRTAATDQGIVDGIETRMAAISSRTEALRFKRQETLRAGTVAREDTLRFKEELARLQGR